MSFISKVALASALTISSAIGGILVLKTTEAEAKSSILSCGAPDNCTPYPYRAHGGYGAVASVCAKHRPCYLNSNCTGEEVCGSLKPPHAN
jgi:hypothetical protein